MGERPIALVTGASLGLGAEFARLLASEGYDLVLTARNGERLATLKKEIENLHGVDAHVVVADLADPRAPAAIHDHVRSRGIKIDVLVNNAGFGMYGKFQESNWQTEMEMVQVNIIALMHLTKLFVRDMVTEERGRIVNVASTAAFQAGPMQAVYYASKAFVLSFSEAIGNELKGTGVTVTALCPGPTPTGFQERANVGNLRGLRLMMRVSPEAVVRAGYNGMKHGRPVVVPGPLNNIHVFLLRLVPRRLVTNVVRKIQTHPRSA
ncbi:MAG TPA: SDR family oxidoreductase [Candidatus Krumholzibacteria bacterium]|nr:SDR family oxidoreductase [Candidatus Krumholzibacteria bacterium]